MLVWRGGLGAVVLFAFMRLRDGPQCWRVLRQARAPFWMAVFIIALAMLVFIAALNLTTVAKVSLIYAAVPFAAAVLAFVILGERPSAAALIASFVAAIGACACLLTASMALPFAAPLAVTPHDIFWLSLFGPMTSGVGFVLYAKGVQRLAASEASLLGALETPLGPLWVWLLFNEIPGGPTLLGGCLIFLTLLNYVWRENRNGSVTRDAK